MNVTTSETERRNEEEKPQRAKEFIPVQQSDSETKPQDESNQVTPSKAMDLRTD